MYKLVAIDLDGTLLTDQLEITPHTITAIRQVVESGVIVTLATGRMFPSAKKFAQQLNLNVPLITYQGAVIKDVDEKKIWFERPVSKKISERLIEFSEKHQVHIQVYQDDIVYVDEDNEEIQNYARESNVSYTVVDDLSSLTDRGFTKVLFIGEPMYLEGLQIELHREFGSEAHIAKSKPNYLEVTDPEANKGTALLYLAKQLGIQQSEIIGIGDNHNDFELITTAGLGVAMGNGVEALKSVADYITKTNNDEGVLHTLEKFILEPASTIK
ncbi:Cof-type HAD-IIB family hydrolase [Sporosarcina gallistercoris]|uniref:HAD family phosphatase n=1 Tax=Sporosarcina gallistercoris TaxID=2762245 RepID=A0ABR8PJ11_9BACL|nr:Cof-type HAD-IIB family hydrolase [Sporosarcina gallistercoris]MBD7908168.1 HAD family phosphatase [Sporosarcina gallistercoris]